MGNVLAAHMTTDYRKSEKVNMNRYWSNGTHLGNLIEDALIKNNPTLKKRACCMGLVDTSRNNKPEKGLKIPIANVGVSRKGKSVKEMVNSPGVEFDKLPNKSKPQNLNNYKNYKAAFNQNGMIIKKLTFPNMKMSECKMKPEDYENSGILSKQDYTSYLKYNDTGESKTCDNFYASYAKKSINDRKCFEKNSKGELIPDNTKPGCRNNYTVNGKTHYDLISDKSNTSMRYPEELSCILSPFSELTNQSPQDDPSNIGEIYGVSQPVAANPRLMDNYCIARTANAYTQNKSEAYVLESQRKNNNICLNLTELKNVEATDSTINIKQKNDCPGSADITKNDEELLETSVVEDTPPAKIDTQVIAAAKEENDSKVQEEIDDMDSKSIEPLSLQSLLKYKKFLIVGVILLLVIIAFVILRTKPIISKTNINLLNTQ